MRGDGAAGLKKQIPSSMQTLLNAGSTARLVITIMSFAVLRLATSTQAAQYGDFTYQLINGDTEIEITGYTGSGGAVSIPQAIDSKPVTSIGDSAFFDEDSVTGVTTPDSIMHLGDSAFIHCSGLESISLGSGITSLSNSLFYNCTALTSVTIPDGIVTIADRAFAYCTGLSSVSIGGGVESIGQRAFIVCNSLTSVTVPDGVTSMGIYAFASCESLVAVSIPGSLDVIPNNAFDNCHNLTDVSIGDGVSVIGDRSFYSCTGLIGLAIPESVTNIESYAFFQCTSLQSVDIPDGVSSIGEGVFASCRALTEVTIPDSVTSIGNSAFHYCVALPMVTVSENVDRIESYAFYHCTNLKSAYFRGNAPGEFGSGVFAESDASFTVYHVETATGFTSPNWNGYATESVNAIDPGMTHWRGFNAIPVGASMSHDLNGDGVSLLGSYAMNWNPNTSLSWGKLVAVHNDSALDLRYFAGRTDVTYRAQTTTDLFNWTEVGVELSPPDGEGHRTASIPTGVPARFMRLVIEPK